MLRACFTAVCLALVTAAPAAGAPIDLGPLHATRGAQPGVFDARGREVLLRGVNVNQLGDYYQANASLDTVVPLTEADFADMARLGFDHVRLILNWSALEPSPGSFSAAYLARIRRAVALAKKYGMYTVLDMHQDAWGKHVATPPSEQCAPGFSRAVGWDGAPAWATFTDGLPTCRAGGVRELSFAVAQAWQSFWVDRAGIQSRLVATWGRLARAFASEPAVAGYDLINEPNPGFTPGASGPTVLAGFYTRAIDAIRSAERSAPGGFSHVVFFEPTVVWSAAGTDTVPPASFTSDSNIVFAPHLYAGSISLDRAVGAQFLTVREGHEFATDAARRYGTTYWSGEWGWFGEPADDRADIAAYAREEDSRRVGGAWWSWKQACGDPHQIPEPGGRSYPISPSLNRFACPAQRSLGIPATTRRILARAYPRAAPGRLISVRSNPETGAVRVAGHDRDRAGTCQLVVWLPGDFGRPALEGVNVTRIRVAEHRRGWLATGCASGRYELRRRAAPEGTLRCLAHRAPIGPRNIGRIRLGRTRRQLVRRTRSAPVRRSRHSYRWCVKRSTRRVIAVFSRRSRRGRARLAATTATLHRLRRVGRGTRLATLRRRFPRSRRLIRGLYRAGPRSRRLFGVRRGRVRFVAVADRRLIRAPRTLRRYLRRAGLAR